jgi:hypothetical protein
MSPSPVAVPSMTSSPSPSPTMVTTTTSVPTRGQIPALRHHLVPRHRVLRPRRQPPHQTLAERPYLRTGARLLLAGSFLSMPQPGLPRSPARNPEPNVCAPAHAMSGALRPREKSALGHDDHRLAASRVRARARQAVRQVIGPYFRSREPHSPTPITTLRVGLQASPAECPPPCRRGRRGPLDSKQPARSAQFGGRLGGCYIRLMCRWRSAVACRQLIPVDRYDWLTMIGRSNAVAGVVCVRRGGPFRGPGRVPVRG